MTKVRTALLPACLLGLALLLPGCTPSSASTPAEARASQTETAPLPTGRPWDAAENTADGDRATVMVYMVGSDLESESALGSLDLEEMARADLGERVSLVVQTMGCQEWHNAAVSPAGSQRFTVEDGALVCQQEDLGQLDSTDPATLRDFVRFCARHYPAERNILIFWDHGAGPVYGFGYDEFNPGGSLSLDEIHSALAEAGVSFDLIGFDACLMGCLETCCALQDCSDYLIASEDFVSGYGWEYQYWLTELGDDVSMPTEELGRTIVDTYVQESEQAGDPGVLALIDLRKTPALYAAWTEFAYANEAALTAANYSWATQMTRREGGADWPGSGEQVMQDYYITDLMALACTLDCEESSALELALSDAVLYSAANCQDSACSGLAVTLPYGNPEFYASLAEIFPRCGLDQNYVSWLGRFASAPGSGSFYGQWDSWGERWDNSSYFGGWFAYENSSDWRARKGC